MKKLMSQAEEIQAHSLKILQSFVKKVDSKSI